MFPLILVKQDSHHTIGVEFGSKVVNVEESQLITDMFPLISVKQDSHHTIGVEFGSKVVNVGGKSVKLQIYFLLFQSNKILTTL